MCFKRRQLHYNEKRSFQINTNHQGNQEKESKFPSNFIKTSRYTLWDFLPKSLLLQFKRIANIYFLFIAILELIPAISPIAPFAAVSPLIVVLLISMTREGYEDYHRHLSDNETNATQTTRIESGGIEKLIAWANVEVGDILKINQNEAFPADLICLGTSYENGSCFIETGALDGEKNLKPKSALQQTTTIFKDNSFNPNTNIRVTGEPPNALLYSFEGSFNIELSSQDILVNAKQLLLRGAFLRNTEWVLGVVVYSGQDTKIMRNAEPQKSKSSDMEHKMNMYIIYIFFFQFCCSLTSGLLNYFWNKENLANHYYLGQSHEESDIELDALLRFFTYFLLYNTMIPISLIVSLEMVKVAQIWFIARDEEMYCKSKDRWPSVMTASINEELGQIEYIFSDKTGTLTCNIMCFKLSVIGSKLYGNQVSSDINLNLKNQDGNQDIPSMANNNNNEKTRSKAKTVDYKLTEFTFQDHQLEKLLTGQGGSEIDIPVNLVLSSDDQKVTFNIKTQRELAEQYLYLLATAHECLAQKPKFQLQETDNQPTKDIVYQGPSPDEITLVDLARHLGYVFIGSSANSIDLEVNGKKERVELLKIFEFDSTRKRMSIVIRQMGVIKVFIKGADNIIKARLNKNSSQPFEEYICEKINDFSIQGLRTLLIAMKVLSEEEYKIIDEEYNSFAQSNNREEKLKELADKLEQNFILIGATAVEDKLQDQVPETINDLIRANIKVWMLTGDKLETAENIAKSCKLLQNDFSVMRISEKTKEQVEENITNTSWKIFQDCQKSKLRKCLIIEGDALVFITEQENLKQKFVQIASECESVVCCRVTPKQKADVVRIIKESLNKITLAIGDGANDVNMIQTAHLGCGIYGNEGMRAVQASDFAFGEFKCLWRLLFMHGRWCYIRISEMILYFFYKNMIFTIPQFYFSFFSFFSSMKVFDDWFIILYNLVFTALPLIARAVFDQDVNYKFPMKSYSKENVESNEQAGKNKNSQESQQKYLRNKMPDIYYVSQKKTIFQGMSFVAWVIVGLIDGFAIFFVTFFIFVDSAFNSEGFNTDLWGFSLTMYSSIVLVADIKVALFTKYWTIFNYVAIYVTSILIYYAFFVVVDVFKDTFVFQTPVTLLTYPHYYITVVLNICFILTLNLSFQVLVKTYKKAKYDSLRVFMRYAVQGNVEDASDFDNKSEIMNSIRIKYEEKDQPLIIL